MKITICGSMVFAEEMLQKQKELQALGFTAIVPSSTKQYIGKPEEEQVEHARKTKEETDAIKDHYQKIVESDAILVLNYTRKNIVGYIGGNTFLEIGFAHVLEKKIFMLNPVPEIELYDSEIKAMRPKIIGDELEKIK